MLLKKTLLLITTICLLSACVTPEERQAKIKKVVDITPICINAADCKLRWELAQLWVAQHINQRIRMQSDVLIETYDNSPNTTELAVRVMKKPLGPNQYVIIFYSWCHNEFGCFPDELDTALKFNMDINLATP